LFNVSYKLKLLLRLSGICEQNTPTEWMIPGFQDFMLICKGKRCLGHPRSDGMRFEGIQPKVEVNNEMF